MSLSRRIARLEETDDTHSDPLTIVLDEHAPPGSRVESVDSGGNKVLTIGVKYDPYLDCLDPNSPRLELPDGPFKLIMGVNPVDLV